MTVKDAGDSSEGAANPARRATLFTIPASLPFVDALALGLIERAGGDPLALARMTVLLPTRRAVRTLRDAFLRQSRGQALLLPSMRPIGDVEDDPFDLDHGAAAAIGQALDIEEAISPMRRQLLLARLIEKPRASERGEARPAEAIALARELAALLDSVQTERLSFEGLADLVPADFAAHWQITIEFLKIVTEAWPKILAEESRVDPMVHRDRSLVRLAARWRDDPPKDPVFAAGSTGSIPATADLLAVIARLPQGAVVLPGLDLGMDRESWEGLGPTHPQFGMRALLRAIGVERDEVVPWRASGLAQGPAARLDLLREAMRPPETAEDGRRAAIDRDAALAGFRRIVAPGRREEASAIALVMREALETEGRTAALVTPDRALARAVRSELARWGVEIDDSAGRPLAEEPTGAFLRLILRALDAELAPAALLALLKHPFCALGDARGEMLARARLIDARALRGPRPAPGFLGLRSALDAERETRALLPWLERLEQALAPLNDALHAAETTLPNLARAHVAAAESLAATPDMSGGDILWAAEAGDAAASFLAESIEEGDCLGSLTGAVYPAVFDALIAGRAVRPAFGSHPRLAILGPLEARLQRADVTILGGMTEGVWPPDVGADPWMSRPMRQRFGLPAPERRIGLSAHDFVQAAAAPNVVLTRASKLDGAPTVPSRWLYRLERLIGEPAPSEAVWVHWANARESATRVEPAPPPAPRPPVAARPRKLSVTEVETWMRDPYALYAKKILRLKPLDPLDGDPGAADRGIIVHSALDAFLKEHLDALPPDALKRLLAKGREAFGQTLERPSIWAFWWPRFERIAAWWLENETERRAVAKTLASEVWAEMTLPGPAGDFTLIAKADRIDRFHAGGLAIVDYKTGEPPRNKQIEAGYAPQLPLEAVLAQHGAFSGVPADSVVELAFWKLSGGDPAGTMKKIASDGAALDLASQALQGLLDLIALFDDANTPYLSTPRPKYAGYGEYDHLARIKEWRGREEAS